MQEDIQKMYGYIQLALSKDTLRFGMLTFTAFTLYFRAIIKNDCGLKLSPFTTNKT